MFRWFIKLCFNKNNLLITDVTFTDLPLPDILFIYYNYYNYTRVVYYSSSVPVWFDFHQYLSTLELNRQHFFFS